jgi:hypothetical protein
MDEMMKLITPENFAMLIAVYLLVKFEKIISLLVEKFEDSFDKMGDRVTGSIDRNTRVLSVILAGMTNNNGPDNGKCKKALEELLADNGAESEKVSDNVSTPVK